MEQSRVEACPADRTNRSRFGQMGSAGSNRRTFCHRGYTTGAIAMGVPGWPEFAAWTASMHKVRIVLTLSASISGPATTAVISDPCHLVAYTPTRNPGRHMAPRAVKRGAKRRTALGCCAPLTVARNSNRQSLTDGQFPRAVCRSRERLTSLAYQTCTSATQDLRAAHLRSASQ